MSSANTIHEANRKLIKKKAMKSFDLGANVGMVVPFKPIFSLIILILYIKNKNKKSAKIRKTVRILVIIILLFTVFHILTDFWTLMLKLLLVSLYITVLIIDKPFLNINTTWIYSSIFGLHLLCWLIERRDMIKYLLPSNQESLE